MRFFGVTRRCAAEPEGGPGEAAAACISLGDFFLRFAFGGGGCAGEAGVAAGGVVVAATGGVGEGVVCVVHLLELLGSSGAFGGVRGDAVRVVF